MIKLPSILLFIVLTITSSFASSPCCGPVTNEALKLDQFYDQLNVESLWQNGIHVDWQTGHSDKPADYQGYDRSSHCSAFVASVTMRLGVYLLRPPEHPESFLASAQSRWLLSVDGNKARDLYFHKDGVSSGQNVRSNAYSVRCVKE